MLRAKGVKHFELDHQGGVKMELGVADEKLPAMSAKEADPEQCRCGHPVWAHTNGLCVHSCDVETCAGPETKE